jgi:hypothetical protein
MTPDIQDDLISTANNNAAPFAERAAKFHQMLLDSGVEIHTAHLPWKAGDPLEIISMRIEQP